MSSGRTTTLFFSVGEPSGDIHGANLIEELRQREPQIRCVGLGGPRMREAGCELQFELTTLAVMGLLKVLPLLYKFWTLYRETGRYFDQEKVDAVVLIDFPGFNWWVAKAARARGIPVYYYCPPQLWAWGGWRVRKMRRSVDHVLAVLPIEQHYFSEAGIDTTYVGHPFFDAVEETRLDPNLMSRFAMMTSRGQKLVAVLPGSRDHEVDRNWPLMLESIRALHRRHADARFLVAAYRDRQCLECRKSLRPEDRALPIDFFVERTSEIIEASHCSMMVSGSVSLEMMARLTPAVVLYRVGRLLHTVAKRMVNLDSITLVNMMNDRRVFPEFVSVGSVEPAIDFLTESVAAFLSDDYYYRQTLEQLEMLSDRFAKAGASENAARWICRAIGAGEQSGRADSRPLTEAA